MWIPDRAGDDIAATEDGVLLVMFFEQHYVDWLSLCLSAQNQRWREEGKVVMITPRVWMRLYLSNFAFKGLV
ncbi:Uncharacterised protein [Zhongshania aliphaticivorans]|uniref:Uncharacterized protein n=1 Tax=Zhongshania aliphaticivorans TaxID=1470434 RepID=A0A5S9PMF2_9GAMM|nr:hypothetical protein [Zhongshania aliphaticivorans]CAA0105541.1 Uncharacterised protein [Zhongshania aliphaticivorans]CAA0105844.1 Uncharacterised protein [Zhongshania aliphaticivorans]